MRPVPARARARCGSAPRSRRRARHGRLRPPRRAARPPLRRGGVRRRGRPRCCSPATPCTPTSRRSRPAARSTGSCSSGWPSRSASPCPRAASGRADGGARAAAASAPAAGSSAACRVEQRGPRAAAAPPACGPPTGASTPPRRAVLADVGAPQLYERLVGLEHLPDRVRDGAAPLPVRPRARSRSTGRSSGRVPWTAAGAWRDTGTVHVAESVDALTLAMAQIAAAPGARAAVPGRRASTRASTPRASRTGAETFWGYTHVPREVRGDAGDGRPRGPLGRARAGGDRRPHGGRARARGARLPRAHRRPPRRRRRPTSRRENANLVGGAINGGTAQLHQQLVLRPFPGLGPRGHADPAPVPRLGVRAPRRRRARRVRRQRRARRAAARAGPATRAGAPAPLARVPDQQLHVAVGAPRSSRGGSSSSASRWGSLNDSVRPSDASWAAVKPSALPRRRRGGGRRRVEDRAEQRQRAVAVVHDLDRAALLRASRRARRSRSPRSRAPCGRGRTSTRFAWMWPAT